MKYIFFSIITILLTTAVYGKGGHGCGHGGGHGGSHGGSHSAARGGTGGGHAFSSTRNGVGHSNVRRTSVRAAYSPARINRVTAVHGMTRNIGAEQVYVTRNSAMTGNISTIHPGYYGYTYEHGGYPYYGYGYGYGYNPYLFNPYYSAFCFGINLVYTPHYNYITPLPGDGSTGSDLQSLDGYVTYEHDTIRGVVTIKPNAVLVDNVDSGHNYDYKFHLKKKGLEYICVYSSYDSSQLSMARLEAAPKKMWRVVHTGRLNVYDRHFDFIYRPEDIDSRTLLVAGPDGVPVMIGNNSVKQTKQRLTEFINRTYNLDLNPNAYSWKDLLIYLDKLD